MSDIKQLLIENKEREHNTANLHASVNGLIAAVQEDMRHSAETRSMLSAYRFAMSRLRAANGCGAATESVMGVIDRQHQNQERMLKDLATGERSYSVYFHVFIDCLQS